MTLALLESSLRSLPLLARGKVRDNYAVGDDRILMVASDRLSAFDVIMGEPIPGKGMVKASPAVCRPSGTPTSPCPAAAPAPARKIGLLYRERGRAGARPPLPQA